MPSAAVESTVAETESGIILSTLLPSTSVAASVVVTSVFVLNCSVPAVTPTPAEPPALVSVVNASAGTSSVAVVLPAEWHMYGRGCQ